MKEQIKRVDGLKVLGALNYAIQESLRRGDDPIVIRREDVTTMLRCKCRKELDRGFTLSESGLRESSK